VLLHKHKAVSRRQNVNHADTLLRLQTTQLWLQWQQLGKEREKVQALKAIHGELVGLRSAGL